MSEVKPLTARDIITATLRSIRVLGVGDPLPADDANDALDRLNDWLDSLALERLTMFHVARTTKLLGSNQQSYTVGIGGDIGIVRPTHIESANLIQNVHDSGGVICGRALSLKLDLASGNRRGQVGEPTSESVDSFAVLA